MLSPKLCARWGFPLDDIDNLKPNRVVSTSIGPVGYFFSNPHPSTSDVGTIVAGSIKRLAYRHPDPDNNILTSLIVWLDANIERFVCKTKRTCKMSVHEWLSKTNYSAARKSELYNTYLNLVNNPGINVNLEIVKLFIKMETYPEYKHARGISSRSDEYKVLFGPWAKMIEEVLYDPASSELSPSFIKHVPVSDRPAYVKARVGSEDAGVYYSTDFSAFESQFVEIIMSNIEHRIFRYICDELDEIEELDALLSVQTDVNQLRNNKVYFDVKATRMSGEMTTSAGNGISNLIFFHFVSEVLCGCTDVVGVVEGDDGLFRIGSHFKLPDSSDFAKLGLTIKIETHEKLETASFCGIVFDTVSSVNITDPIPLLMDLPWLNPRYHKSRKSKKLGILKAKLMSNVCQYPGCPIIYPVCVKWLKELRNIDHRVRYYKDWYAVEKEKNFGKIDLTMEVYATSRSLMSEKFGISEQKQLEIERVLCNVSVYDCNFNDIIFAEHVHPDTFDYRQRYVYNSTVPPPEHVGQTRNLAEFLGKQYRKKIRNRKSTLHERMLTQQNIFEAVSDPIGVGFSGGSGSNFVDH